MRRPLVPVAALLLALAGGSAFAAQEKPKSTPPTQAKAPAKADTAKSGPAKGATGKDAAEASRTKTELKPVGVPVVKESVQTPEQIKAQQAEWKKMQEQEQADVKARRDKFKAFLSTMAKEGVVFKKSDKPNTYRVIAPSMAKTDAGQRKAAAKALVTRVRGQMEPILKKKLTFEVYSDDKGTQRVDY